MKEKTIWSGDLPAMLDSPYISDIHACGACAPLRDARGELLLEDNVCPAAKDVSYNVGRENNTKLRCDLISALVKGNVNKALKLGEKVEDHHGKNNLTCDPLTGVKKIRKWLRRMGVELQDNRSAQGDVAKDSSKRVQRKTREEADREFTGFPG